MMLANDKEWTIADAQRERYPLREQIEGLVDYLDTWQYNVKVGMERAEREPYTEFNKGSQFGQNEVLTVCFARLRAILDAENSVKVRALDDTDDNLCSECWERPCTDDFRLCAECEAARTKEN